MCFIYRDNMIIRFTRAAAVILVVLVVDMCTCLAQGETAVPFLLISPYAEANGMGEASVANHTDDPLSHMTNPAHLGMFGLKSYFSFGHNYSKWLPQFNQSDLWIRTYAVNAGVNLKQFGLIIPEIGIGFGYSRIYLNLGEFTITGQDPTPLGTFTGYETSNQYSFGVGIDYWVKLSGGITFKHIFSSLAPFDVQGQGRQGVASVNSYDYGLLLDVPIVEIVSKFTDHPLQITPQIFPFFNASVGLAKNNLGDKKLVYIDAAQADPLPRYARIGIGFDLGVTYGNREAEWRPISFKWTIEANDILVRRSGAIFDSLGNVMTEGSWEYRDGLGDIHFFDEVILGHTNSETIKKKGWELNFFEILSLRGGRFEESPTRGNRHFNTTGYSVRFFGIIKFLRAIDYPLGIEGPLGYIVKHLDVRFDHSELKTDEINNPLAQTKFNSISIVVSN